MTFAGPIAALTQALREMMRIAFKLALCLLTASALSTQAHAQESSDSPRIGLLQISTSSSPHLVRAFTEGMRTHGFVEGRNVRYEIRYHGGDRMAVRPSPIADRKKPPPMERLPAQISYMIWLTTPPSARIAAPVVAEAPAPHR